MDKIYRSVPTEITLSEENTIPDRVQILRTGIFYDPRYGEFKITPEFLLSLKKNFDEKILGVDIAIDYAHETDREAAGWIKGLELSDNDSQLWAQVEWTPNGRKVLSDKEFRYLSADIANNYENNETRKKFGPTLKGAGLTNRPVIKEMAPVIQLQEGKENDMEEKEKEIAQLKEQVASMQKAIDEKSVQMAEMEKELCDFRNNAKKMAEEKELADKKALFDKQLSEGRVCEAQREAYMSGDMAKFIELAQSIKLADIGTANTPPPSDGKTQDVQEEILKLAEKAIEAKEVSSLAEGIQKVLKENVKLRDQYIGL